MADGNSIERLDDVSFLKIISKLPYLSRETCKKTCKKWLRLVEEYEASIKSQNELIYFSESNKQITLDRMSTQFKAQLESIRHKPQFILTFLTESCRYEHLIEQNSDEIDDERANRRSKRRKLLTSCFNQYKKYLLDFQCSKFNVFSSGVVSGSLNKPIEIESYKNEFGISTLAFANYSNIRCKHVTFKSKFNKLNTKTEFDNIFNVNNEEEISYMLILISQKIRLSVFDPFLQFLSKNYPKFAISGGCVEDIQIEMNQDEVTNNNLLILGFISIKNKVKVRQVVIEYCEGLGINEKIEACKRKLTILKESLGSNISKNSFALQIVCIGRGKNYYSNKENIECDTFKSLMPHIPITGFFGYGELGYDYLKDNESSGSPHWMGYSSVFTIFSIND